MTRLAIVFALAIGFAAVPALAEEPTKGAVTTPEAAAAPPAPERWAPLSTSSRDRWRGRPYLRGSRDEVKPEGLNRTIPVFLNPVGGATPNHL